MTDENIDLAAIAAERNEQVAQRKAKLAALRADGQAYPNHFSREHLAADLHAQYDQMDKEALAEAGAPWTPGRRVK